MSSNKKINIYQIKKEIERRIKSIDAIDFPGREMEYGQYKALYSLLLWIDNGQKKTPSTS